MRSEPSEVVIELAMPPEHPLGSIRLSATGANALTWALIYAHAAALDKGRQQRLRIAAGVEMDDDIDLYWHETLGDLAVAVKHRGPSWHKTRAVWIWVPTPLRPLSSRRWRWKTPAAGSNPAPAERQGVDGCHHLLREHGHQIRPGRAVVA